MWILLLLLLSLGVLFLYLSHLCLSSVDHPIELTSCSEKSLSNTSDDPIELASCSEKSLSSASDDLIELASCSEKSLSSTSDDPIKLASCSEKSLSSTSDDLISSKYDVFISFRGTDTRNNFIGHLYDALCRKKILVYKDDVTLPRGEEISPALFKGIEDSRISIVVFSENYAMSRWCLEELVHILKCKREKGQVVLPVFYKVDPSHVRKQQESYAKAFVEHEKRFKDDMDKVLQWRSALEEAGNHSGWDSRENRSESELVEEIAQVTLSRLYNISVNIGGEEQNTLVGIEEHVDKIVSMLCFDSPNVRIIGIWGMGGIGKTTLADVVQKRFYSKFENWFFVDVGNEVRRLGLRRLVKELFDKLLKGKDVDMNNPMAVAILQRTKVFVVLDNVDDLEQVETLVGASDAIKSRFGEGSRIILTSRDKKLLEDMADDIYKVESLNSDKALELFNRNAFRRDSSKIIDFIPLSKKVVDYAKGNPLALKVLGSYLHSRRIEDWKSALSELREAPNQEVQKVLKISYDALDRVKQSLLLDIGCFFNGELRETAEVESYSHIGINVLVEKCLITIDDYGRIWMHDLIQEMAWEIVRQESSIHRKRSRLWDTQVSFSVLGKNKGSARIEGIFLDLSKMSKDLYLPPTVFEAMENLRIIKFDDSSLFGEEKSKLIHFDQGLQNLPDSLRYLNWNYYPLESLPPKFEPQNLVRLKMQGSKLKKLWDGNVHLENLKDINLSLAKNLIELPNLDQAAKLERLNLMYCERLHRMPNINGKLKQLDIRGTSITEFQPSLELQKNLQHFNFGESYMILKNRSYLPDSFSGFASMEMLQLSDYSFERIHSSIKEMTNLKHLSVTECWNIESVPDLPSSLQYLNLSRCKNLKSLPNLPSSLQELYLLGCENLESLPDLPSSLQLLDISESVSLKVINARGCMSLQTIKASGCTLLTEFGIDEHGSHSWKELLTSSGESCLSFLGCLNLEQSAKTNILIQFQRILFGLNTHLSSVLYPGNEIPKWITHQHEGNSVVVTFPKHCYTLEGIVASAILEFKSVSSYHIVCKISFNTRRGVTCDYSAKFDIFPIHFQQRVTPHVCMVYIDVDDLTEELANAEVICDFEISEADNIEIKRCGIHFITQEEAEDFIKQMTAPENELSSKEE